MPKKIRSVASESGYKLRTLHNEPVNLTISNGKAPFDVKMPNEVLRVLSSRSPKVRRGGVYFPYTPSSHKYANLFTYIYFQKNSKSEV